MKIAKTKREFQKREFFSYDEKISQNSQKERNNLNEIALFDDITISSVKTINVAAMLKMKDYSVSLFSCVWVST